MMAKVKSIDISDTPELLRLAEEVRATGETRVLRRGGEDLALLTPVSPKRAHGAGRAKRGDLKATPTAGQIARSRAGILAAAGSWKECVNASAKTHSA